MKLCNFLRVGDIFANKIPRGQFMTELRTTIELDILDKILVNLFIICKYVIAQMRQATQASGPFVPANQAGNLTVPVRKSYS